MTTGADTAATVIVPVAEILRSPGGPRERQMLWGQTFRTEERRDGWVRGTAGHDGYPGWVAAADLGPAAPPTHVVAVRETYAKATPKLTVTEPVTPLFFGSRVAVERQEGRWWRLAGGLHAPREHLRPVGYRWTDPAGVAEMLTGAPYLWGGNSGRGIDCSGLVQAAMLACGIDCPGDSDQQEASLGEPIAAEAPVRRSDLFFWRGHVAMAVDADTLIHANAGAMAVSLEGLRDAVARIAMQGDGPVTARRRVRIPGPVGGAGV